MPSNLEIAKSINAYVEDPATFPAVRDELIAARDHPSASARESSIDRALALVVDDEVLVDVRGIEIGRLFGDGRFRGLEGFVQMWATWFESWDEFEIAHQDWQVLDGGEVLQEIAVDLGGRSSGAAVQIHHFHLWAFRDGKVVRLTSFPTREEALEATEVNR